MLIDLRICNLFYDQGSLPVGKADNKKKDISFDNQRHIVNLNLIIESNKNN